MPPSYRIPKNKPCNKNERAQNQQSQSETRAYNERVKEQSVGERKLF